MLKQSATALVAIVLGIGMAGCSTNPESEGGSMQQAGATAGRVIDDSAITAKVKAALVKDSTTKAHQIEVETFQGTVQLSGFVDDAEARSRASQLAANVEGVKDVKNDIQLRGGG